MSIEIGGPNAKALGYFQGKIKSASCAPRDVVQLRDDD